MNESPAPVDKSGRNILGISAKSIHAGRKAAPGLSISAKSIHAGRKAAPGLNPDGALLARSKRYTMQRTAQSLLYDGALSAAQQKRVCWCQRSIKNSGESVGVYRQADGAGARFSGLTTCGSVWHCPVCAAKITETRRRELDLALTAWVRKGNQVQLMTLTFPHNRDQALPDLLDRFAKALQSFKNSRTYKRTMEGAGRAGSIRSLEATWGENGWHPHTHDLVFLSRALQLHDVDELKKTWVNILLKQGLGEADQLTDMMQHGLDIQDGRYAAEYIAKFGHDSTWGAASELTKPHGKVGMVGTFGGAAHYSPFQLLAWATDGDDLAGRLFRDYADAFEGKRMLSWSPKLRAALDLLEAELSDEDIAAHDDPKRDEAWVGDLSTDQFKVLLSRNRMGDFLGYVARCCFDPNTGQADIDDYIAAIAATSATHGAVYRKKNHFGPGWSELH